MTKQQNTVSNSADIDKLDKWFDSFIESLQADKFLLKEDLASEGTKHLYGVLMDENIGEMMRLSRSTSKMYFIESMIKDYLTELKNKKVNFKKIALDLGTSKLLSWVELSDDDENSEDNLIMAEAKLNAKYKDDGFHVTTTIVEERDHIPVPSHYHILGA
jgi:hexokinase